MKRTALAVLATLAATFACGCDATPPPAAPTARVAAPSPDLDRTSALDRARADAASRYGDRWIAWVDVQRLGRYWVVELRASNGKGLHYAIATDGAIKERSMVQ
jgi:hypothetical protein